MKRAVLILVAILTASSLPLAQAEKIDFAAIGRIKEMGLTRSEVMDHIFWLADVYGPRLTGTPAIQQASEWAMQTFNAWGLSNVHQERWRFGKGWSLVRFHATLVDPQVQPIIGYPQTWTPGTKGTVTADVVRIDIASEGDFAKYRGKLAGKIVLTQPARQVRIAPLKDLGVTILGPRSVTSTDHVAFDEAGVPAFQFLVDRLEYNSRTHHSNMDTFDRVQRDDMVQQATVIATSILQIV